MYRLLAILVVASVALAHENHDHEHGNGHRKGKSYMSDIPECQAFRGGEDEGWAVPNCADEVVTCFKEAHDKAKVCVGREMIKRFQAGAIEKSCYKAQKDSGKEWFRLSCKWHLGVNKCMNGDTVPSDYEYEAEEGDNDTDANDDNGDDLDQKKENECFALVNKAIDACVAKSDTGCSNYKFCSGRVAPDTNDARLDAWYQSIKHIKLLKETQKVAMKKSVQECIAAAEATEP